MKNIKKYIAAFLLFCITMQPVQVNAEEMQEVVTQEKQQASTQEEIEMKNVEVDAQTADTTTVYETADGFTYTLNENNEATITGCTSEHSKLVVPGMVNGYVVKAVGRESFEKDNTITKITILENVEIIDCFAFSQCMNVEEVILPSTIKIIKNYAFKLGKYTNVEIPDGCECVAVGAFESTIIYDINIPKSVIRIGYNESDLEDNNQYKISLGSPRERIVGNAGSLAEEYANALGYTFINIEWIPLQQFVLPENIQLNVNERVEIPIPCVPEDTYSEFRKIDGYHSLKVTDEGVTTSSIVYEVVDGKLYATPTEEGVAKFEVYKNAVFNYFDNYVQSNICTITVVNPSKINVESITLKDGNNNTINNTTLSYDTYNTGCTYPITLETNPLDANEDITFTTTNENLANVSKVNGNYVLTLSNAYILTPRTCTITATGKRSGVTTAFDVQIVYGGAASIAFDSSFENNKQGKVNRIVNYSEYDLPIKIVPESLVNDSTITIIQNPQTVGETVITYDKTTSNLKAVGVGTATIKAECKGQIICYDFEVSAYEKKATSVTIDTNDTVLKTTAGYALAMNINDTYQLGATVLPIDTTDIRRWIDTSKNGVISIDNQGNVIASKAGTAKVTVYEGSYLDTVTYSVKSDELTVTVTDPNAVVEEPEPVVIHATNYVLNNISTTMKIGEILQLNPLITPTNTTDKIVYKTNDSSVAAISDTGLVTVVGAGTTWVSGTVNGMWQGIKIRVEKVIIQPTITLSTTSLIMKKGETKQISATLGANTLAPLWESNNTSIVTVAADGAITAVGTGTTYVQATALSVDGTQYTTALCDVAVTLENTSTDTGSTGNTDNKTTNVVKESGNITLNASKLNIQKGKTTKALAINSSTYDEDNIVSATSTNIKILKASVSGDKIVLKGVKTSNKYVTVIIKTESGATATCSVKVVKNKVSTKKLKLSMKKVTLKKGETTTLTITQTPISATDRLTWSSSNKKVATVNKRGKIVAKKKGSATITLKSSNGKKVTCKVTIK